VVTPAASGIVSISLDHTSILGNTVEEIAREKAGIIKPGKTVVVGALPDAALRVVEEVAQTQGSEIWRLGSEVVLEPGRGDQWRVGTPAASYSGLVPGIRGAMQPENMAVAIAMMDAAGATCSGEALAHGAKLARVPGRFEIRQVRGQTVVLDGAHNSQAAEVLARSLDEEFPGKRIVLLGGMVGGHDPGDFFKPLARLCDIVLLTEIDFHRAVPPEELRHAIAEVLPRAQVVVPFTDAVELALAKASDTDGLLVVTGSFYLVGAVGRYLNSIT
ncbi:MAG TPA: cyanophycin synthetase, partial [Fimbriimonadaceae bacterium]|nr:cyanophycin synthetase [Fimbriimonadaceae bacterium]